MPKPITCAVIARRRAPAAIALAALTALAALALPALAAATIVVDRGVDRARIGMTEHQLRAKLGKADVAERSGSSKSLVYRRRKLVVTLFRGRVQIVSTDARKDRTAGGVGPGSTLAALRRHVSGERCGEKVGVYSCKIGSSRRGRRSTVFLIEHGRVATVSVALTP
ncbi:MAG TPA: hypothetical protein VHZ31_05830 [Solirubrobacteraceae bacterium]|nr:hypothetical protein [Solirubrobacteraceae bacterium]